MKKLSIIICMLIFTACGNQQNDKFIGNWIEVMPVNLDIVQGITLEKSGKAKSINMATLQYYKWETSNDKIILWGKSIGNGMTIDFSDTLNVIKVTADSMILDKLGMYRINYYKVNKLSDIKPFNVIDSLKNVEGLTELETRTYNGSISTETNVKVKNELTIYNYKNCGDGVYKLGNIYTGEDSSTTDSYGRLYTLRGDATDINAVVYQLVPFDDGTIINLLYKGDKLVLLNDKFEQIKDENNTMNLSNNTTENTTK